MKPQQLMPSAPTSPSYSVAGIDADLRSLAARQLGAISRRQVTERGVASESVGHRVAQGEWVRHGLRVLVHAAAPDSDERRAMEAVLDAGGEAAISHSSAAAVWGLPGFRIQPCHITIRRRSHTVARSIGTVHRMRALRLGHITMLDQIPVVRPELMLLQLAGFVHPNRVPVLLDRAWSMRLLSGPSTRRILDEVSASGVRGVAILRAALDERGPDYVPPASNLEGRFTQILETAGLPRMRRQVDLGAEDWCGRVDFRSPDQRVVIEVDSERYHSALSDVAADEEREAKLRAAGFVVGRITDHQVFHRPDEVCDLVRKLLLSSARVA